MTNEIKTKDADYRYRVTVHLHQLYQTEFYGADDKEVQENAELLWRMYDETAFPLFREFVSEIEIERIPPE